jgi:Domain of unknown function (DUF222)
MSQASFPGPGQDGEEPLPSGPAWDEAEDDFDMDAEMTRFLADIEAGRERVPDPWEEVPACTVSLGEACDVDPAALGAMAGPDGLGGESFAQARTADAMRPGPVLSALTEQAADNVETLSDNQLLGLMSGARRLQNRAEYLELQATAEFARRRAAQFEASKARKDPRGCRDGEFAAEELAFELVSGAHAASDRMEMATALATRLPETFAGLAAGTIDRDRAWTIYFYTRFLSDEAAAEADKILAAAAPELRYDQLSRKAAGLEKKLDPEGVKQRKEEARKEGQRVEARREASGNMSFGGRELAAEDALAAKARIDADAIALRNAGVEGSLRQLRVLAFLDRINDRDPMDRIASARASADAPGAADQDEGEDDGEGDEGYWDDEGGSPGGPKGPGTPAGGLAPLPALTNLIVPVGTLLGWSNAPGDAGAWGLLDSDDTRRIVQAASRHPRSRWCVTVTGEDGTAIAHGCARGQHRWTPAPSATDPEQQATQLAEFLRQLNVTLTPIAKGTCDHRNREDRYTPSRRLKHLVRARTARCPARGCNAQSYFCDQDHTMPYPAGPTDECNLSPPCRRHHRCKQAPGWRLEQPEPGVMRWTTPAGRVYTTTPTTYDQ